MILLDPDLDPDPEPTRKSATSASLAIPSRQALAGFLVQARAALRLRGQVTVLLTTDREIRRLNRQFRRKDKATDVLSFLANPLVQNQKKSQEKGDLAISVPTARRQANACGHSLATELKVLMLHGLLHLAGYDHETDDGRMARRENALRARLGLPQGLIERAHKKAVILSDRTRSGAKRKGVEGPASGDRRKGRTAKRSRLP
jgi:probable rRNA maturation factor